jgi:hypothetical protein
LRENGLFRADLLSFLPTLERQQFLHQWQRRELWVFVQQDSTMLRSTSGYPGIRKG